MRASFLTLCLAAASVRGGTVVWNGLFNDYSTPTDFDKWSFSNEVGSYQSYIHGGTKASTYLQLSPNFKNPADTPEKQGIKITIDSTSLWNSDMERTELIPQTSTNIGTGHLYYHFSVMKSTTNPPNPGYEHQVNFFESHFTEMKTGWINGNSNNNPDNHLRWMVNSASQWSVDWVAGTWYNFAYDINFSGGSVGLWTSTGSDPLVQVVPNLAVSAQSNSADWHLGVLRLPNRTAGAFNDPSAEDWYFSGVYIEQAPITTTIGGEAVPAAGSVAPAPSSTAGSTNPSSTAPSSGTSTAPSSGTPTAQAPTQTHFGQCGGQGFTGPTVCASPFTCVAVSPPYYSQCQ